MQRFAPLGELFKGRHFDQAIVVLCVRWYLSFKLSYRDLVAMTAECGIDLAHTTILRARRITRTSPRHGQRGHFYFALTAQFVAQFVALTRVDQESMLAASLVRKCRKLI